MTKKNNKDTAKEKETNSLQGNVIGEAGRITPKLCTTMQIGVLSNRDIILTMLFGEHPSIPPVVIERVVIDTDHAKRLVGILDKVVKDIENADK